jgi:predicted HD superfamily hydrolase involved in NAD metabolism
MNKLFTPLTANVPLVGDVPSDVTAFLIHHGHPKTADHCACVAAEAERLALRFGEDGRLAQTAGWLHDVSAVFPNRQRAHVARQLGLEILPEEVAAPMIVHQKLSAVMARQIFGVTDKAVLSAIACHSTLKANASLLDKIVFIADKIAWDQPHTAPFLEGILAALEKEKKQKQGQEQSLDQAVLHYLDHLWQRRDTVPVVHPWFVAAYEQLSGTCTEK